MEEEHDVKHNVDCSCKKCLEQEYKEYLNFLYSWLNDTIMGMVRYINKTPDLLERVADEELKKYIRQIWERQEDINKYKNN